MPLAIPAAASQLATLADLPFELVSEILGQVDRKTLLSLVLVSNRLYQLIQPIIYPNDLKLDAEQAYKYLLSRVSDLPIPFQGKAVYSLFFLALSCKSVETRCLTPSCL